MSVIVHSSGDLFAAGTQAIVNPVNCVGVSGAGLALAFKNKFPENQAFYQSACRDHILRPGGIATFFLERSNGWIVNLATKDHWKNDSQLEWVQAGAANLARWAHDNQISSIACPALGAGKGALDWEPVREAIIAAFEGSSCKVDLYAPWQPAPARTTRYGRY